MPKSSKKNRSKRQGGGDNDTGPIVDERFAAASNRPQFRTATKPGESGGAASGLLVGNSGASKVELDDRFAAALTDPRFRIGGDTGDVDKYGRKRGGKRSKKNKKKKNRGDDEDDDIIDDEEGMSKFYTLKNKKETKQNKMDGEDDDSDDSSASSSSESSEEESDAEDDESASSKERVNEDDIDDDGDAPESNDPEARIAYLTALSRGEIDASSSSDDSTSDDDSSDDDSQSDASDEDSIEGIAGVLDPSTREAEEKEVEITHEESPYLAVCNMDWTQVRAVDLFAILSSFCPPGSVKRVRVYPSDFGMERMKKEEVMGPAGIWKKQKGGSKKKSGEQTIENDNEVNERFEEEEDESSVEDGQGSDHSDDDEEDMDEDDVDLDATYEHFSKNPGEEDYGADNDFDPEKLRAYEASKMKYYFAVATFASSAAADAAYREVDGMEVGHSSAMIDLRSIPPSDIKSVVKDREVRDECDALPSTYESPDFVVAALQQTAVRCTWEDGDTEREKKLTQYGVGNEAWAAMTEGDDLRAYLASDHSSDEDSDEESNGGGRKDKGARMRALLGLGSDDEGGFGGDGGAHSDASSTQSTSDSEEEGLREDDVEEEDEEEEGVMTTTYIPGKRGLEDKIRSKLEAKKGGGEESAELTPWEKYQLKRKEKRRERRQAIRAQRKEKLRGDGIDDDGSDEEAEEEDAFFLGDDDSGGRKKKVAKGKKTKHGKEEDDRRAPSTKEELELLIAGDNDEETERDFDMRGIARKEKLKGKKLKGKRKRKEAEKAADVSGTAFSIDTTDNRFAAVLDGSDERFGIDRTDPNFKDTPAMQKVLAEQSKRRKAKKRAKVANDVSVDAINRSDAPTGGAAALSSLVKSLKTKVANKK